MARAAILLLFVMFIGGFSGPGAATRPASAPAESRPGDALLATSAPSLDGVRFLTKTPVSLESMRGKVVLVRWWMAGCPFCVKTAPALREFAETYNSKGLQILAIYHPKPRPAAVDDDAVLAGAEKLNFIDTKTKASKLNILLGVDADWTALRRWWLFRSREFTSVSFLMDKKGTIRYVHPGGEYHKSDDPAHADCNREYVKIQSMIELLLKE